LLYNNINIRNKAIELAASVNIEHLKAVVEGREKTAFVLEPSRFFDLIKEIEKSIESYMFDARISLEINKNRTFAKIMFAEYERVYKGEQQQKQRMKEKTTDGENEGDTRTAGDSTK
jgi:hypothetical protein